jgi:hypothetical protein
MAYDRKQCARLQRAIFCPLPCLNTKYAKKRTRLSLQNSLQTSLHIGLQSGLQIGLRNSVDISLQSGLQIGIQMGMEIVSRAQVLATTCRVRFQATHARELCIVPVPR